LPDENDEENRQLDLPPPTLAGCWSEKSGTGPSAPESGDLEPLVAEMQAGLLRLGWSILRDWSLASDAVQEAFSLLGQKLGEIEPEHRAGWVVRTVQLQAMAMRRKRGRLAKRQVDWSAVPEARLGESGGVEDALLNKERVERLRQEIDKLPSAQRRVVQLRLQDERSFAEIASDLGLPLGTVLSRMRLATQKLRGVLREGESSGD
jgi:RNA polymerase sigma-70 factor (ECF subfamily)